MANWKKVLVSGSQIHVAGITASNIPSSGGVDDRVVVFNSADGEFKSVTQGSIQGITVASFGITGSDASGDTFNATTDILTFAGDITSSVAATAGATGSTLTLNLPQSILSSSGQIANDISGAFDSASNALVTNVATNTTNIATNVDHIGDLTAVTSSYVNNSATSSFAIIADISGAFDSASNALVTNVATNADHIGDLTAATGSYITNIGGTNNEITVTSASDGAQVVVGLPDSVTVTTDLTVGNNLTVLGLELIEGQTSIVSGAFTAGSGSTPAGVDALGGHQFTGSLSITGAFSVDGTATITNLSNENSVGPTNIVVHNSDGKLFSAGANVTSSISGAFDSASNAIVGNVATNTTNISTNTTNIGTLSSATSSYALIANISGAFDSASNALVTNVATNTDHIGDLTAVTSSYVNNSSTSSFAIIADISGAFDSASNALVTNVATNTTNISTNTTNIATISGVTGSYVSNIVGTANEITVSSGSDDNAQVTIGLPNDVTIGNNLTVTNDLTVTQDLIVKGTTTNLNVANVQVEDQFILLNSGALGSGNANDKDGGFIVNTSTTAGEGTAFFYDFNSKVWALKGADGNSTVAHDVISNADTALGKDIIVATVSQSNVNPFSVNSASLVPKYGIATDGATAGTNLGSMHVNSTSGEIWIYS
jgi:hypothetical protein